MTEYKIDLGTRIVDWLLKQNGGFSVESLKQQRLNRSDFFTRGFRKRPDLYETTDRTISGRHGEIPVRIYRPTAETGLPIITFYHGGGFVIGNLDTYNFVCQSIAHQCQAVVVSVDYRLAPENPYPIPVEDCYDALMWVADNAQSIGGDSNRLVVMGDSAGGNLSAVMTLLARENSNPVIKAQVLIYPAVDSVSEDRPSKITHASAPILREEDMVFFIDSYVPDKSMRSESTISPLCAESHQDLPTALILVAEYDPLHDEGVAYAEALRQAGSHTELIEYPNAVHGFFNVSAFSKLIDKGYADIANFIKRHV